MTWEHVDTGTDEATDERTLTLERHHPKPRWPWQKPKPPIRRTFVKEWKGIGTGYVWRLLPGGQRVPPELGRQLRRIDDEVSFREYRERASKRTSKRTHLDEMLAYGMLDASTYYRMKTTAKET